MHLFSPGTITTCSNVHSLNVKFVMFNPELTRNVFSGRFWNVMLLLRFVTIKVPDESGRNTVPDESDGDIGPTGTFG